MTLLPKNGGICGFPSINLSISVPRRGEETGSTHSLCVGHFYLSPLYSLRPCHHYTPHTREKKEEKKEMEAVGSSEGGEARRGGIRLCGREKEKGAGRTDGPRPVVSRKKEEKES